MHLSSDRFKSTFHRVRAPIVGDGVGEGERMSLAWFNQPCKGTRIVDRMGKYEELSAEEFILRGMKRNYEANMHRGMETQTQSDEGSILNGESDGHTTE
jgi:isopenicillin N synthase-like dioxygenase